jgi:signal transduction histidine kinase
MLRGSLMMSGIHRPTWIRYGAAVVVTVAALGVKLLLFRFVTQDVPGLLFFAAVILSALFGGMGAGILATALGALFDGYFFMPPFGRLQLNTVDQQLRLGLFVVEGIFISLICARMTAARNRAEESENESRGLQRKILEVIDAEQRRIGHDLHDGLGQHLTGISMMLQRHQKDLEAAGTPNVEMAEKLLGLAQTAVEWTHDLSRSLSPPALESHGLAEALHELASRAENLFNIDCTFEQIGEFVAPPLDAGVHLYRIAQEAISNSVKHGNAKHIQLRLQGWGPVVVLEIIDDGSGLKAPQEPADGMGLRIMEYRARMIGAKMEAQKGMAGGTIIRCRYTQIS